MQCLHLGAPCNPCLSMVLIRSLLGIILDSWEPRIDLGSFICKLVFPSSTVILVCFFFRNTMKKTFSCTSLTVMRVSMVLSCPKATMSASVTVCQLQLHCVHSISPETVAFDIWHSLFSTKTGLSLKSGILSCTQTEYFLHLEPPSVPFHFTLI